MFFCPAVKEASLLTRKKHCGFLYFPPFLWLWSLVLLLLVLLLRTKKSWLDEPEHQVSE